MTKIEAEKTIELYTNCLDFKESVLYWKIKCFILENNDTELLEKLNQTFGA
jgi:hypothetical protein